MPVSIDESLVISPNPTPSSLDPAIDAAVAPTAVADGIARSPRRDLWRRLRGNRPALAALILIGLLLVLATVGAPLAASITGHPPNEQYTKALDVQGVPIGPGQRTYEADSTTPDPHGSYFLLGADRLERDQLVRVLYGLRVSLT